MSSLQPSVLRNPHRSVGCTFSSGAAARRRCQGEIVCSRRNTLEKKIRYKSSLHKHHRRSKNRQFLMILISFSSSSPETSGPLSPAVAGVTRYSSEENSGNESNESHLLTEQERQADFNRRKEEMMKRKRRRKKRTSSSIQSSCFLGKQLDFN